MRFKDKPSQSRLHKEKVFAFLPHRCRKCEDKIWWEWIYQYRYVGATSFIDSYICTECDKKVFNEISI